MSRALQTYELVYILVPELRDIDLENANQRIAQIIDRNDGAIIFENHWGTRKLAYAIQKKMEGYYVMLHFEIAPDNMVAVQRMLNLDENVMRYLLTRDPVY